MSEVIKQDLKTEALKLALEGLEKWHFDKDPRGAADYIAAIHDALAEPPAQQQEPVAVMTVLHLKDRTEIGYGPASAGYDLPTGEYKLYTSPQPAQPSKPWVGLTDEEIHKMTVLMGINPEWKAEMEIVRSVVRNLEAKLWEKNA